MMNEKLFDALQVGQVVIFDKVPLGSYTSPGEEYLVESKKARAIYFRNIKTGGGTFDQDYAVNRAIVRKVA